MLSRTQIKEILLAAGLTLNKRKGQVFITNRRVVVEMAQAAVEGFQDAAVFEFGTGLGNLTHALAERAKLVFSIEIDAGLHRQAARLLRQFKNVTLLCADGLKAGRIRQDLLHHFLQKAKENRAVHLVFASNMPYSISGALLVSLPFLPPEFERVVVMCQREVADRIEAEPGSKDFGPLSVLLQRCYTHQRILNVPREAFYPKPEVASAVLRLDRKPHPEPTELEALFEMLNRFFGMRRKTLLQNLRKGLGLSLKEAERLLDKHGISCKMRPEEVEAEKLWALAECLSSRC